MQDGGDKKKRKRSKKKKKKDPNEPRKPKSAYLLFCAEFRSNLDPPVSFIETTALVCSSLHAPYVSDSYSNWAIPTAQSMSSPGAL